MAMHEKGFLKNILFLDIETVSLTEEFNRLDARLQKEWIRKSEFLNKDDLPIDEFFEKRAAIYSEFGKIIVIGLGILYYDENKNLKKRVTSISNENEAELLKEFSNIVNKFDQENLILCAHNGKEFDFPYLSRRMVINNVELPEVLKLSGKKPWQVNHLDTMEMWKFGDRKSYTSLELIAASLNLESSKSNLDGSQITNSYYKLKDINSIKEYCESDVRTVIDIYLRLNK